MILSSPTLVADPSGNGEGRHRTLPPVENGSTGSRPKRKRLTVYLPVPLLERLRNTFYWTKGTTLAGVLEASLSESLDVKEREHGSPFPPRLKELKGGRPKRSHSGSV
jgi:hypothetical protein